MKKSRPVNETAGKKPDVKKFNTFNGVFIPSFEAILGSVLFLIIPYLTAGIGLCKMGLIILLANTVTIATSFSIADCATNLNKIGGGGMYAVSKKSLGKAFGGSIGIQLYLAQAVSIGFYAISFARALQPILNAWPAYSRLVRQLMLTEAEQFRYIGLLIAFLAFIAGMIGADFIVKIQMIIFVVLTISVTVILISPAFKLTHGNAPLFRSMPNFNGIGIPLETGAMMGFWMAFTTFFPAVTGIDAGVGMSGNLENPRRSLVSGTFIAIAVTTLVYFLAAVVFSLVRPELLQVKNIINAPTALDLFSQSKIIFILIITGILFATGSSALSYFMTSPRTCQALSRDNILPRFLKFLKRDFTRRGDEPRWATILTFLILIPILWPGDVSFASRIVGICFLVVYGWINLAAFLERISGNPSFRPTSRGHWAISLYGYVLCMLVIALDSFLIGLALFSLEAIIFILLLIYKSRNQMEGVWWGVLFNVVKTNLNSLKKIIQGSKNWRPILTAVTFNGKNNCPDSIAFLSKKIALHQGMVHLNILESAKEEPANHLDPGQFQIPTSIVKTNDANETIQSIIQSSHPGGIEVNSILMEYVKKLDTVEIINRILSLNKNVLILKNSQKLKSHEKIDIWWRGEKNGNLMVLLAFIINNSIEIKKNKADYKVRIIRKLGKDEDGKTAHTEMLLLLEKARLTGEVTIIPYNPEPFNETLFKVSKSADLIMMGLPGNINSSNGLGKFFKLNKVFFDQEILKYDNMPAVLFVKSAYLMNLIEE